MKTCCACGFKLQANENNISFYKFPQNDTFRKAWCDAVGPNFSPARTSVLCSQHFLKECFFYGPGGMKQRKYIKQGSLPTIFGFRGRKFRDIPESIEIMEETFTSTNSIHVEQSDVIFETIDDVQVESVIPIIHDEEVMNKQDNLSAQPEITRRKKSRNYNPRFVGDCDPNDFKSPRNAMRNWKIAMSYIETQKKKIKLMHQQNRRLRKRVTNLKSLLSELKDKNLISRNAQELLSVSLLPF